MYMYILAYVEMFKEFDGIQIETFHGERDLVMYLVNKFDLDPDEYFLEATLDEVENNMEAIQEIWQHFTIASMSGEVLLTSGI